MVKKAPPKVNASSPVGLVSIKDLQAKYNKDGTASTEVTIDRTVEVLEDEEEMAAEI